LIIDVHVHVFPPEIVSTIDNYLKKDPFLNMICNSPYHKYASLDDLLETMSKYNVDKAITGGFSASDQGLCSYMNDYILEGAYKYPGKILPMISLSPNRSNMERELDRCLEKGAIGVGELFPWGQEFDLKGDVSNRLANFCKERKLPLLLHVNEEVGHYYSGKGDISVKEAAEFAIRHPGLNIIFAHWGGGLLFYELMPELKKELSHVFYDTSAGPFLYSTDIYRVAREIGLVDKILFGTDYPLIKPGRYYREMSESGLSQHEIRLIQGENARKIWNL